jgi:hypothetical protein
VDNDLEECVLDHAEGDPSVSTTELGRELNISHIPIWSVLHEQLLYLYHLQAVQNLMPADYPAKEMFCWWFTQ